LEPPVSNPINGAINFSVKVDTTFPKAPPITKATAMSIRLPFRANALNSLMKDICEGVLDLEEISINLSNKLLTINLKLKKHKVTKSISLFQLNSHLQT
jgi:hypothetical protein